MIRLSLHRPVCNNIVIYAAFLHEDRQCTDTELDRYTNPNLERRNLQFTLLQLKITFTAGVFPKRYWF
jgi:hypothetical protein